MRMIPEVRLLLLLLFGLAACAGKSEEADETTRVATDTLVERREVVDTMIVRTDSTIAADTTITADTTVAVDTAIAADTSVAADTSRLGGGVIDVDTTRVTGDDTTRQQ
jgi:hypothetical protein